MGSVADSTAKQITGYFSHYADSQRWVPEEKVEMVGLSFYPF
jgi:hypothetical protein